MSEKNHQPRSVADAAIFVHCNRRQRARIQALSTTVEVKAGYELTREGTIGLEFGIIVEGTATVTVGDRTVATLGPGDHYGEVAVLDRIGHRCQAMRMATVVAVTGLRVAVMTVQEFASMLDDLPDVADAIRRAARDRAGTALVSS